MMHFGGLFSKTLPEIFSVFGNKQIKNILIHLGIIDIVVDFKRPAYDCDISLGII